MDYLHHDYTTTIIITAISITFFNDILYDDNNG